MAMPRGMIFGRQWIVLLRDGRAAIDWGDGLFQTLDTGEFLRLTEKQISHSANDGDLAWLRQSGQIASYDEHSVYLPPLPDRPRAEPA